MDVRDLTLMLLYLTSWQHKSGRRRAWKGYDFDVLDELRRAGALRGGFRGSRSIWLTADGETMAQEALARWRVRED